jgi:hypothetical protein
MPAKTSGALNADEAKQRRRQKSLSFGSSEAPSRIFDDLRFE